MKTVRHILGLTPLLVASLALAQATKPSAKAPARRAKPVTVELPLIASPKPADTGHNDNAEIERLVTKHNAAMTAVTRATLVGKCVWVFSGQTGGRPMTIDFARAAEHATITCGNDPCEARGAKVTYPADTAMLVDAHYLVAFRTYDPRSFTSLSRGVIDRRNPATEDDFTTVTIVKSTTETLSFDTTTGRLLRAVFETPKGNVTADFDDFIPIPTDAGEKPTLPASIGLFLPPKTFSFAGVPDNPEIRFLVNADQSRATTTKPVR